MEKKKNTPKLRFPEFTEEWEEKKLGEIAEIKSDKYNPEKNPINYKCIELEHLATDTGQLLGFINSVDSKSIKNKFETGDVLFGKLRPYLRKFLIAPFDGVCSSEIWVLNGKQITNWFLYYLIQTDCFLSLANQSTGSKMPRADWSVLSESYFNISNQEEQTKIATFLTAVDEKLTQLKKKKTLLEQYKKGVMQKLFSQELRFKDDNNQDFPDWEEKLLGEICELITKGTTPTSIGFNFTEEGVKFIKVESLTEFGEIIPAKVAYISNECHQALKRSQLKVNDILFSIAGALGRVGIVKQEIVPSNTNQALAIIRLSENSDMLVSFLAKYLVSDFIVKEIESLKAGAAQLNLSLEQLNRLIIPIPSLPEQQKIANFLSSIDEKISHRGKQIEKMEAWKKGLLQQMFC